MPVRQHAVIEIVALHPGGLDAQKARGGAVDRSPKEQKKHQEKKHDRQRVATPAVREEASGVSWRWWHSDQDIGAREAGVTLARARRVGIGQGDLDLHEYLGWDSSGSQAGRGSR